MLALGNRLAAPRVARLISALALAVAWTAVVSVTDATSAKRKCAQKKEEVGCTLRQALYESHGSHLRINAPHSYAYALLEVKCNDDPHAHVLFANFGPGQPGSQLLLPAALTIGKSYTSTWHLTYPSLTGTRSVKATISSAKTAIVTLTSNTHSTGATVRTCKGAATLTMKRAA